MFFVDGRLAVRDRMKGFCMFRYRLGRMAALFALPLTLSLGAHAQYDPGASAMLGAGYGFNALSQSTMSNAFRGTQVDEAEKGGKAAASGKASRQTDRAKSTGKGASASKATRNAPVKLKPQYTMADVERYMQQRQAFHAKTLEPEYHRRVRANGEASAGRWLRARSHAIGLEEGAKARALFAQN